jgi:hypothetical protein
MRWDPPIRNRDAGWTRSFPWAGGSWFSRRSWVCGPGGHGLFCRIGIQQQFELSGVDRLALRTEQTPGERIHLLAEQVDHLVTPGDFIEQALSLPVGHLRKIP